MQKAQAAYKRDFDARLRGSLPANVKEGDYAFVRKTYYNPECEERHKLSPVDNGHFRVISAAPDTAGLGTNNHHERLSRDRVVFAPTPVPLMPSDSLMPVAAPASTSPSPVPRPVLVPYSHRGLSDLPRSFVNPPRGIITRTEISSSQRSVVPAKEGPPRASTLSPSPES